MISLSLCDPGALLLASTDADLDQVDVEAIRRQLTAMLRAPSAQPARKALLRLLIEEIRVASRESIQPPAASPSSPGST